MQAPAGRWALALRGRDLSRVAVSFGVAGAVLFAGVPTAAGFTKNYLCRWARRAPSSPTRRHVAAKGPGSPPSAVVETDYRGSVAYFTGHRTAWTAFTTTAALTAVRPPGARQLLDRLSSTPLLRADDARYFMVGDLNLPCSWTALALLSLASSPARPRPSAPCACSRPVTTRHRCLSC